MKNAQQFVSLSNEELLAINGGAGLFNDFFAALAIALGPGGAFTVLADGIGGSLISLSDGVGGGIINLTGH